MHLVHLMHSIPTHTGAGARSALECGAEYRFPFSDVYVPFS